MSAEPKISVKDVSLSYYSFNQGVNSMKDLVTSLSFSKPFERHEVLHDINFEVMSGEVIGIIGKNGAGKSTLLKAVAGMIEPNKGKIIVKGKVAPVLAIGAGIEMELTGYENIKLLVSLIGNRAGQLKKLMPNVVSFSELTDEELNRPVKTYSTGMISRLSFSIAVAHQPDILIIDEVLAVGDFGFQTKCIKRIEEIRDNGSTILFVSHNIEEVKKICTKALYLANHGMVGFGDIESISKLYMESYN
ncbi:MAG: ABC transporter ATP-binding protein [Salibacteraceae bacterium]